MLNSVDQKLLKATKFPPEFSKKVDMQKVNLEVLKKYVVFAECSNHQASARPAFEANTELALEQPDG